MSEEKKEKKASARERKFAKVYVDTGSRAIALKEAGYNASNQRVATEMGRQMLQRPHVQREIDRAFESFWPSADKDLVQTLQKALTDPATRVSELVRVAEVIIKMKGHAAPTKHQKMIAKVSMPLPLPGHNDGDDE